jgi:hypothetical protein
VARAPQQADQLARELASKAVVSAPAAPVESEDSKLSASQKKRLRKKLREAGSSA